MANNLCIYHHNCLDGFAAAWVTKKALKVLDFHPGVYGEAPPDVTGKDVYIVDFSYKRPVLEEMISKANSVTVLDHHKTAEQDLEGVRGANIVFDMNRSGATIAWDYFFPDHVRPKLITRVEDRDLWRFAHPDTKEVMANVASYPYDFEVWDKLMHEQWDFHISDGEAILRNNEKNIKELLTKCVRRMNIGGYNVPVANLPGIFASEAGHILCQGEHFAGSYWDAPDKRVFSLRSSDEGLDVSRVAKLYNGGGHRNAAGFSVSFELARLFEV